MAVNTCSNIGTGRQVFASIVGTDAQFRTLIPSTGINAVQNTNDITFSINQSAALTWTSVQNFGTPGAGYSARFDPSYGDFNITRNDTKPVNPTTFEVNAFAADVTRPSGIDVNVPFRAHAYSDGTHAPPLGACWGIATEAWNLPTKTAQGGQLIGGEFSVINAIPNSNAGRHCGVLIPFKNRLDTQTTPQRGSPGVGDAYNKNSMAIYIDSATRGSVTSIECGWNKGIYFGPWSLDTAVGAKAVGIDMTAFATANPAGGKYSDRILSAVAVPSDTPVSYSTDMTSCQLVFNSATGNLESRLNGSQRFAVNQSTGVIFCWNGSTGSANTWLLDLVGAFSTSALFNMASSSRIAPSATGGGATAVAPAGYVKIQIDGNPYKLAFYNT